MKDPEATKERHWARVLFARKHADKLISWCEANGVSVRPGDGSCWKFNKGSGWARWSVSTAHLAITDDVRHSPHSHGKAYEYEQVIAVLAQVFCDVPRHAEEPNQR